MMVASGRVLVLGQVQVQVALRRSMRALLLCGVFLAAFLLAPDVVQAATLIVNSTADTAPDTSKACTSAADNCTLREAILKANALPGADVIHVPAGTYTLAITGTAENDGLTGDLDITGPVTIIGSGGNPSGDPTATIIQAGTTATNGIDRVFHINPLVNTGFATTFQALWIRHGKEVGSGIVTRDGGGIYWAGHDAGTLTLENVVLSHNLSEKGRGGGLFAYNSSTPAPSAGVFITNSTIEQNEAAGNNGGGMFIGYGTRLVMNNSKVLNNIARLRIVNPDTGNTIGGVGGGIELTGPTIAGMQQSQIRNSIISGNSAIGNSNPEGGQGGGMIADQNLLLEHVEVSNNSSTHEGAGLWTALGDGGAMTLRNVTISGNVSDTIGGGLFVSMGSSGAAPTYIMQHVTITNNRAKDPTGSTHGGGSGGGGLFQVGSSGLPALFNTIVGGNFHGTGTAASDIRGTVHATSAHNLIGTGGAGGLTHGVSSNHVGISDLRLGPLANNGGQSKTHALLAGSLALDGGSNSHSGGATTDQRGTGFHRTLDAADSNATQTADIGAYEAHPVVEDIADKSVDEDTTLSFLFHVGDHSLVFDSITVTSSNTTLVPNSTASLNVAAGTQPYNRTLNIIPAANQFGSATITVTVTDTHGGTVQSMTDTFTLTVNPVADPPVATGTSTAEDTQSTTGLTINRNAVDGAEVTHFKLTNITGGTLYQNNGTTAIAEGSFITVAQGQAGLKFTPAQDQNSPAGDSFGYTVQAALNSSGGGISTPVVVTITVWEVNDPPVPGSDTLSSVAEDSGQRTIAMATLLANDSPGPANESGQSLTITAVGSPTGGTVAISGTDILFTPAPDFNGTASFSYTVQDTGTTNGVADPKTASGTVSFTVWEVNDPPVAANDTLADLAEDAPALTIAFATLTGNDSPGPANESGQSLTITAVSSPTGGTVAISGSNVVFTPAANYHGPAGFSYTVQDNGTTNGVADPLTDTASVAFSIYEVNDPPTAGDDTLAAVAEDAGVITIAMAALLANDSPGPANEAGQSLSITAVGSPTGGTVAIDGSNIRFTLTADFNGTASFVYTVTDDGTTNGAPDPQSATATASFAVWEVNDPPVAQADTLTAVDEDAATLTIAMATLLANDSPGPANEAGQSLSITAVGSPTGGTVAIDGSNIRFTLTADFHGTASFDYTVTDDGTTNGAPDPQSATATASFTVNPVADTPSVTNASTHVNTQTTSGLVISRNPADGAEVSHFKITNISGGTLYQNDGTTAIGAGAFITYAQGAAGLRFTPALDSSADGSFDIQASTGDADAGLGGATVTATITVLMVPDLVITKSHSGDFRQGQTDAAYTITVSNAGSAASSGLVTVTDTPPAGLTPTGAAGSGWSCAIAGQDLTCTRSDGLAAGSSYPAITLTVTVADDAPATLTNTARVEGGDEIETSNNEASDPTSITQVADLTITKSTAGSLTQGESGAVYTLVVSNVGPGPTVGTVTVTDLLPPELTAVALSGTGWNCTLATLTCTRSDILAASASYPAIALTVDVANDAPPTLTNTSQVWGGGELNTANNSGSHETTITQLADLIISKSHTGSFLRGLSGFRYTLTVTNQGLGATAGTVTVTDTLPAGLTATALTGEGWTCSLATLTCTRSDALGAGESYPAITLEVAVAASAPANLVNEAAVAGGGQVITGNDTAADPTQITDPPPPDFITISVPTTITREASILVSGSANPGAAITVNGEPLTADGTGNWSLTVALQEGENLITATNGAASQSVTVIRDTVPPPLTLTASETFTESLTVLLTAVSEPGATLVIEGVEGAVQTRSLHLGANFFSATATDLAGNTATATVKVVRVAPKGQPVLGDFTLEQERDLTNGYVTLYLPAQATAEPVQVLIEIPGSSTASTQAQTAAAFLSVVARVELSNQSDRSPVRELQRTATLVFTYDPAVVANQHLLRVYYYDAAQQVWVGLGGEVDEAAHTITVRIDHFTLFALLAPAEQAPVLDRLPARSNSSTITLTGTAEPGAPVSAVVGGTLQVTGVADAAGTFALPVTLTQGPNRIYVKGDGNLASREEMVAYQPLGTPGDPPAPPDGPGTPPAAPFRDVAGHWAEAGIGLMVERGVVRGYADNTFRPEAQVSRVEFAVMLARLLGLTPSPAPLTFTDQAQIPEWGRAQVAATVQAGIITGRADGSFDPEAPVSRAEVAVMLVRALQRAGVDITPGDHQFADSSQIPDWARAQVLAAARLGLVTGYGDGSFRAQSRSTRAEAVTMLARLLGQLPQ